MRKLKHEQWPHVDHEAFRAAYQPGDIFDGTAGSGAHLSEGTRRMIETAWRRFLGFLAEFYPDDLLKPPADRITPDRIRNFIDHLSSEVRMTTVAHVISNLCYAARLIEPAGDWRWLAAIKARLAALARPEDRFDRLIPPWQILDLGIELMEQALKAPSDRYKRREILYRDGLLLALLSLWPIRRRSITALTVSRHLQFDPDGVHILLYPEDTKAKRAESFRVPEPLLANLMHYLKVIRPRLIGRNTHDGLWASYRGLPLSADGLYDTVRARLWVKFGKSMSLHDIRRSAATFLATDAPDLVGLTPGVLQQASLEMGEQHYNLARSVKATRRFAAYLSKLRDRLRPVSIRNES